MTGRPTYHATLVAAAALAGTAVVACVRKAFELLGRHAERHKPDATPVGAGVAPSDDDRTSAPTAAGGGDRPDGQGAHDGPVPSNATGVDDMTETEAGGDEQDGEQLAEYLATHTRLVGFMDLMRACADSGNPIEALRETVDDIIGRQHALLEARGRDRGGKAAGDELAEAIEKAPTGAEVTFARWLDEAGLMRGRDDLPHLSLVHLGRTKLYYLGVLEPSVSVDAARRILAIESAINRMVHALILTDDEHADDEERLYRSTEALRNEVCAQAPRVLGVAQAAEQAENGGEADEWELRTRLAEQIEGWRLPHRLEARYRCDARAGRVAIEFRVTPEDAFRRSTWIDELGRVVPTTRMMRRQAADDYALRMGLLLAAGAFGASGAVSQVWVAGVIDDATGRECLLSAKFSRWGFSMLDLSGLRYPSQAYHALGARIGLGERGLEPVDQGWSLDDGLFTPVSSQLGPELAWRPLASEHARALGCDEAFGMAIDADASLEAFASQATAWCTGSAEDLISHLMPLARHSESGQALAAAERVARDVIAGRLDPADGALVEEELARGDGTADMLRRAFSLAGGRQGGEAIALASDVLARLGELDWEPSPDGGGARHGRPTMRSFRSYAERLLYNRLAPACDDLRLAPKALQGAHFLLATLLWGKSGQDDVGHAEREELVAASERHALRACELDPMDGRAKLHMIRVLEDTGRSREAIERAKGLLLTAHRPDEIGIAYYRLAYLLWQDGDPYAAEACYRASGAWPSVMSMQATIELHTLLAAVGPQLADDAGREPDAEAIVEALRSCDVPVAPTERVLSILTEGSRAAMDAGLFPVAHELSLTLARLLRDDVIFDVANSLAGTPDKL